MYYITEKRKGKRVAIAAWDNPSPVCLADAEDCFGYHGLSGHVSGDSLTAQGNYGGLVGPVFRDTVEQVAEYTERRRARDYRRIEIPWSDFVAEQEPRYITEAEYMAIPARWER